MTSTTLRFGTVLLDVEQRQLLIDGRPARLGARAFDVLLALVERRDRAVSKNELFELVWPNVVVEENNLQVHISALRKLLGPQTIATIPGRGYRFTAEMASAQDSATDAAAAATASHGFRQRFPICRHALSCCTVAMMTRAPSVNSCVITPRYRSSAPAASARPDLRWPLQTRSDKAFQTASGGSS